MHDNTPGSDMLQYHGQWREPNCDMRVLAMGFPKEHLTAVPLTEATHHRLLGSCIDGNIVN